MHSIICGDSALILSGLPSDLVDLIVTSPPYDNLRSYKGFNFDFDRIAQELFRVTKKGGVLVWVVNDATIKGSETGTSFRQALKFMDLGFLLHDTMIYAKKNPVPLTHNRYEQCFEYMFVFSKGKPKTFNPIKVECVCAGKLSGNKRRDITYDNQAVRTNEDRRYVTKGTKIKNNIWEYAVGIDRDDEIIKNHPARFPDQLALDHVISWSNKGDLVLDPMMGSGTVGIACRELDRRFIGIDISKDYCKIAKERFRKWQLL